VQSSVTGLILAGGKRQPHGRRGQGSADVSRQAPSSITCSKRLAPQVGGIIINANQNQDAYRTFGVRVVSDAIAGYAGPLAGMHAGLSVSKRHSSPRCPAIRRSFRRT